MSVVLDNYRRNAPAACPSPPDAAIQPLDSSARNPLICMALTCGPCGLRATFRERGRSEEWSGESGMWPGTANSGGGRSPQEPPRTRGNRRDQARKTPNRERLGFHYWWRKTEPNPRPFAEPDGNALALRAWIRRFGRIAHPALGFLVKQRVHGVPAPLRSTTPEWHSSWFHSRQAAPPRGLALARSFFAKPRVPRRSSSLLPDQPPHD